MPEHWFLFPIGILVGSLAMSSGVSGSNFWIPVYLVWLRLEPRLAFWVALATMLFGFGSGVIRNVRARTVDWRLAGAVATFALPATALGANLAVRLPTTASIVAFAVFVECVGVYLLLEFARHRGGVPERRFDTLAWPAAVIAGALQGAIATGAGIVLLPALVGLRRIEHHATAMGTTVVVVFACALVAVAFRIDAGLWHVVLDEWGSMVEMIALAGSGAAIGGQLGPSIAQRIPRRFLRLYLGLLLLAVGALVASRVLA